MEVLGWLAGPGIKRRAELIGSCSAVAAGTCTPASRRYDQGNTQACKLYGCGEKREACSDGNKHERSKVLDGGGNGRRGEARCLAREGGGGEAFIAGREW
jgi:hypothetical protein